MARIWYTDCNGGRCYIERTSGSEQHGPWWSSGNPGVAGVSSSGLVTGVSGGSTSIGATYRDNRYWPNCVPPPCHTPCNSVTIDLSGGASVTVWDFTVSLSPPTVQPDGIGGNPNTTVTVQTFPAVSGKSVTLQDVRVANTGGHPANHPLPNSNVTGTFTPSSSVTTDSNGRLQRTYKATIFSGRHQIKATMSGRTQSATLQVMYSGLGHLSAGANYYNSNTPAGQIAHPDNWWGTSSTRNGLVNTANAYAAQYPGERVPLQ